MAETQEQIRTRNDCRLMLWHTMASIMTGEIIIMLSFECKSAWFIAGAFLIAVLNLVNGCYQVTQFRRMREKMDAEIIPVRSAVKAMTE